MTDLVINFSDPESKRLLYNRLRDLNGEYCIQIKKKLPRRSIQANRYYWGVVLRYLSETTGENPNVLHQELKFKFVPDVVFLDDYELTTTTLDAEQIWDYIDLIRAWASSFLNCRIPDPNEAIF